MSLEHKQHLFQQSYTQLFDTVYRYVRYRVPHTQDAEDIVADVLLKAYSRLDQFNEEAGNIQQWISGIMRNAVIDFWRSRARHVTLQLEEALLLVDVADAQNVENVTDRNLLFERVMEKMPDDMKALFALRYIDGLTYQEIATLVNKKPETIRKFFSRIHQQLRGEWEDQYASSYV